MKRFAVCLTVIVAAASMCGAAVDQTIGYVQVNPLAVQPGGFNTNTGTVGQMTVTGLAPNQCVQTGPNGLLMVTGANCGTSGGGGSSSLQVTIGGVQVTSPTASINLKSGQFTGVAVGSTSTIALNGSSVTLQGNAYNIANIAADTGTFITASSTSLTYLQISSAVATYIQRPELVNGYLSLSSATATYIQASSYHFYLSPEIVSLPLLTVTPMAQIARRGRLLYPGTYLDLEQGLSSLRLRLYSLTSKHLRPALPLPALED